MKPAAMIICETAPRWVGCWRPIWQPLREKASGPLPQPAIRLREARSLVQTERLLQEFPASCVACEVTPANLLEVHAQLIVWAQEFRQACVVVLARDWPLDGSWELPLRAAGAVAVAYSPLDVPPLVQVARLHLSQVPALPLAWREEIWTRLPWPALAK